MRARAHVRVHATGVPAGSMTIPHKGTFPVDLGSSNSLIGEFLHVKGVVSDAPTTEIVALVEPRHTVFSCKCCPGHETHRMLLIGDSHFAFEKVAGDHRQPRHRQDDDAVAADSLATNESPGHNHTVDDQFSEPFDVANKRLLLAPARTFRRRVLAGLIQDVYVARPSISHEAATAIRLAACTLACFRRPSGLPLSTLHFTTCVIFAQVLGSDVEAFSFIEQISTPSLLWHCLLVTFRIADFTDLFQDELQKLARSSQYHGWT